MMDITDIDKVANRKRLSVDSEKLREKVSRETTKIIKLKVAQDTAYWDLKEKLQQLENNHERLQQNMVEVQMQHETISGQYQDELRLRPEMLNKLGSTRDICNVLEESSERLKETLSRCKSDQTALCDAYQKSGVIVKDIKMKQILDQENKKSMIRNLEEKLKITLEHQNQLVVVFNKSKQQTDDQIQELKTKLETTHAQRDELVKRANDLTRELDHQKHSLELKDNNLTSLKNEMKRVMQEFNNQCTEMKNVISKQEKEIKDNAETNDSLKKALSNQEQFTKSVCLEKEHLIKKVSSLEEEGCQLQNQLEDLKLHFEELKITSNTFRRDLTALSNTKEVLEKEINEKSQTVVQVKTEIESLNTKLNDAEAEKARLFTELTSSLEECRNKSDIIVKLQATVKDFEAKSSTLENDLKECRNTSEITIKDLNNKIEIKNNENLSKGETITKLMNEIKILMEVKSRMETNLEKARTEIDMEKEKGNDKERKFNRKIEQYEITIKDKEDELSKQMSIILETRSEKERLQEKISSMQNSIDNIRKELTGRFASREVQELPEQDDNAVSLTPFKKNPQYYEHDKIDKPQFAVPKVTEPNDNMIFKIFSDSSVDGDSVDPIEVNRRFEALARGERISHLPLSALKRRRRASQGGLKMKTTTANDSPVSLSQFRNEIKTKEKKFFKHKRDESKFKKFKKDSENKV